MLIDLNSDKLKEECGVFGIFTGLAMLTAMTLVLTLMPQLIAIIKPFKNG